MSCSKRTAQIFSLDLVFAMLVFSSLIGAFFIINSKVPSRTDSARIEQELSASSERALYSIVASPGRPSNWTIEENLSKISSIGIAFEKFSIDSGKVSRLNSINSTNYSWITSALGLSRPGYEAEFFLRLSNGTTVPVFGIKKPGNNETSLSASAGVSYQGSPAIATLVVWMRGDGT